jgi:hypothetical protein
VGSSSTAIVKRPCLELASPDVVTAALEHWQNFFIPYLQGVYLPPQDNLRAFQKARRSALGPRRKPRPQALFHEETRCKGPANDKSFDSIAPAKVSSSCWPAKPTLRLPLKFQSLRRERENRDTLGSWANESNRSLPALRASQRSGPLPTPRND